MFPDPLDVDPDFADYNFSVVRDPKLQSRVEKEELFWLVYRSRQGDPRALDLLVDTFRCTLSNRVAEMFEREHAHRPVPHREWLTDKFFQLSEILLYENIQVFQTVGDKILTRLIDNPEEGYASFYGQGPYLQPNAIEDTLRPEDVEEINWHVWLGAVCATRNTSHRVSTLVALMKSHRRTWRLADLPESGWEKNSARDGVILSGLGRDTERKRICGELDRRRIQVNLPALSVRGFQTWEKAWADPDGRQAIQRLFSKLLLRLETVKHFVLSE